MIGRRGVLQGALALVTGRALAGTAGARSSPAPDHWPVYDPSRHRDTATTVAVQLDPSAVRRAPVPESMDAQLQALANRFEAVSIADLGPIRAALALEESTIVAGGAVASARFDRAALAAELRTESFAPVGGGESATQYYRSETDPLAVGIDDSRIFVGYDGGDTAALSQVTAVETAGYSAERDRTHRRIAASIDASSLATATLGSTTTSWLREQLPADATEFASLLRAAKGFGVGISVGETRSQLTYALDLDFTDLSFETVWNLGSEAAAASDPFELDHLDRKGRLVVASGTAPTDQLWAAQEDLFGVSFETAQ